MITQHECHCGNKQSDPLTPDGFCEACDEAYKSRSKRRARYFVTFSPGHYGDRVKVLSTHYSYRAAFRAIQDTTTLCIRFDEHGNMHKGSEMLRANESLYPYATGDET